MTENAGRSAQIIHRPNRLKAKVSGSEHEGPGAVAKELVEHAREVMRAMAVEYPPNAEVDLSKLLAAWAEVQASPADSAEALTRLRLAAREIMGQGETFGYPLLTRFGRTAYDLAAPADGAMPARKLAVLKAHVDAMTVVIRQRITGDGGELGRELVRSLADAAGRLGPG